MTMLRFTTAGESHGPCLTGIVDGVPAGLALSPEHFVRDLAQRQRGYGRGGRMRIEVDAVEILGGVVGGVTIGAPVSLRIENRDWPNWKDKVVPPWTVARPGHVDLAGSQKYAISDMRLLAERASARETAMRVAAGVVAKRLLAEFGISTVSHVVAIGKARVDATKLPSFEEIARRADASEVRCADPEAEAAMKSEIDDAKAKRDSIGGIVEVIAMGVPPGLGTHAQWDRKLDGLLAQAVMSIQAIKGVEIGEGFGMVSRLGTEVHDQIYYRDGHIYRPTNRAGGIEGGITNGEPVVVRAVMKPIPTTIAPLHSIDTASKQEAQTQYQRSDVCAVPAASVVAEAMVAWTLAAAFAEKFGGDSISEMQRNVRGYLEAIGWGR